MPKNAHELTRKEMKGPDRFQVAASDAASWMAKRQKQLLAAVIAVVALAVVVLGLLSWRESSRAAAGGLLDRAIDAAGGEVSSAALPGLDRPVYKTTEERARAVLAAAQLVRSSHGGSRAATTAALLEGDAQLTLRSWDKAAAAYQAFLDAAPADDAMRFSALDGLARSQEGKGELDRAASTYERAAAIPFYRERAELERARVLVRAGKADEARRLVEGVAKGSQDPSLQAEAQERLARLGGK